jgi:CheY-like chemotaxis protein
MVPKNKQNTAILCVDDDAAVLDSLWIQLERTLGKTHIIESAESGEEGLEVIDHLEQQGIKVILIVTDWLMPDMDGGEFVKQVKEQFGKVPTVVLSGQSDTEQVEQLIELGLVSELVQKPWDEEEICAAIINAVRQD